MIITVENTTKFVNLECGGGTIRCRVWEGQTKGGVKVHCFIPVIAVAAEQDQEQFQEELQEQRAPSPAVEAIPLRLIL